MRALTLLFIFSAMWLATGSVVHAEEILFEDNFADALSPKWEVVGLSKDDYRIKNGALEMRIQKRTKDSKPRGFKVVLPIHSDESVTASVKVDLLNPLTEEQEFAGIAIADKKGPYFSVSKQRVNRMTVFTPGEYAYAGNPNEDEDPTKYKVTYWQANDDAGELRIILRGGYGYTQVGPSKDGKYLNFFHSAVRRAPEEQAYFLTAEGAPAEGEHWVRFDNLKVVK